MAAKGQKPNTIKRADLVKVFDWLRDHWQEIEEKRPTMDTVAAKMSADLAITISWVNVRNLTRDLGKTWPAGAKVRRRVGGRGDANAHNKKLDIVCRELLKVIQFLQDDDESDVPVELPNFNVAGLKAIVAHAPMSEVRQSTLNFSKEKTHES